MTFVAVLLGLLAVPATASALKFEAAPGTPLAPATSVIDPSPVMPPGFSPTDIATGDFNKDGYGDIAVITDYISVQGPDGPEISPSPRTSTFTSAARMAVSSHRQAIRSVRIRRSRAGVS